MSEHFSKTTAQLIADWVQRYIFPENLLNPAFGQASSLIHKHFTVAQEAPSLQAQAWQEYLDRSLDVAMSRQQINTGFRGEIDTYVLKDMVYLDSKTSPYIQARTLARISRDNFCDYIFHVTIEGICETITEGTRGKLTQYVPGIVALDMQQPGRMVRPTNARVLAFFLPRSLVEAEITDAESIHGRVVAFTRAPHLQLLRSRLQMLTHELRFMHEQAAENAIRSCAHLVISAFSNDVRASQYAARATRFAIQEEINRYIRSHLHSEQLSPELIQLAAKLPRATLYRMFEHEGGLWKYIRNCRLREAANDLVRYPQLAITEIAYGLCFNSASDFTRAFKRAYGMSPMDFRMLSLAIHHESLVEA
jgi:AraC-like DNA-binding protein